MPKITFSATGQTYEVESGISLLEFCQSNDTPVNFGCSAGNCGTCASKIESAEGAVNPADDDEKGTLEHSTDDENARLCCLVTVLGDITVGPL